MDAQAAPLARWRAKPRLEKGIQTLQHLFVDAFNVGKTAPAGQVAVFASTLEFGDEFRRFFRPDYMTGLDPLLGGGSALTVRKCSMD